MTIDQLEKLLAVSFKDAEFTVQILLANGGWIKGKLDIIDRNIGLIALTEPDANPDVVLGKKPLYFGVSEIVAVHPRIW